MSHAQQGAARRWRALSAESTKPAGATSKWLESRHGSCSVTTGTVPLVTFSWENVTMGTVPVVTLLVYAAFFSPSNRMYQYTPRTAVKITAL